MINLFLKVCEAISKHEDNMMNIYLVMTKEIVVLESNENRMIMFANKEALMIYMKGLNTKRSEIRYDFMRNEIEMNKKLLSDIANMVGVDKEQLKKMKPCAFFNFEFSINNQIKNVVMATEIDAQILENKTNERKRKFHHLEDDVMFCNYPTLSKEKIELIHEERIHFVLSMNEEYRRLIFLMVEKIAGIVLLHGECFDADKTDE